MRSGGWRWRAMRCCVGMLLSAAMSSSSREKSCTCRLERRRSGLELLGSTLQPGRACSAQRMSTCAALRRCFSATAATRASSSSGGPLRLKMLALSGLPSGE